MSSLPNTSHMQQLLGSSQKPFIIGVCGGTASGKTTVCKRIIDKLQNQNVAVISQDSFYRSLTPDQLSTVADYNFDHPNAFDYDLIESTVRDLREGKSVEVPNYDFVTHSRAPETTSVFGADVILFEGILIFYSKALLDLFDMKIFVDADSDTRLARRVVRDIRERGRDLEGVLNQYARFVKPAFDDFILPTKKFADIIVPRGADNEVAINLISQHISHRLTAAARSRSQASLDKTPSKDRLTELKGSAEI